jgi:chaperonin GroES
MKKKATKKVVKKSATKSKPKTKTAITHSAIGIQPLGEKVLIRPFTEEEMAKKSAFGIILPDSSAKDKTDRGEVVAVGEGHRDDKGVMHPIRVKVGDKVLFQWGDKIEFEGKEYFLVSDSNLIGIIK